MTVEKTGFEKRTLIYVVIFAVALVWFCVGFGAGMLISKPDGNFIIFLVIVVGWAGAMVIRWLQLRR